MRVETPILWIDDEQSFISKWLLIGIKKQVSNHDLRFHISSFFEFEDFLTQQRYKAVITDLRSEEDDIEHLLTKLRENGQNPAILVFSGWPFWRAETAFKIASLRKPASPADIGEALNQLLK